MGDEEDSREGGTEDVTYHAREPDAGNAVAARAVDEARDDERERDEEDDLAGEASDDGNPGLVDRLEELRIGDCEGDKRGESHEVAKGRDADSEDGLLGIEAADDEAWESQGESRTHDAEGHADLEGEEPDLLEAVVARGTVVVAGYRLHALAYAEEHHEDEAGSRVDDTIDSHGVVAAILGELHIKDRHDGEGSHIH